MALCPILVPRKQSVSSLDMRLRPSGRPVFRFKDVPLPESFIFSPIIQTQKIRLSFVPRQS